MKQLNKFIGNCEHPCDWEVLYNFKPNAGKMCDTNNAKNKGV
jgi:hypothetical protein